MFFKTSAVLAFALAAPAAAKSKAAARNLQEYIHMDVMWQINDGPKYANNQGKPEIKDIPCGTSQSLTFYVMHDMNGENVADGDVTLKLFDKLHEHADEPVDAEVLTMTAPLGDGATHVVTLTFTCGDWNPDFGVVPGAEDTCTLDLSHNGVDTSNFDGEKSSWARMYATFDYEYEYEGATYTATVTDTEEKNFFVGCATTPSVIDDPHFRTWNNRWYDYMGECDLTFVDAPNFSEDAAMRINIRTKARYDYSFIESAVIQIGDDTMEVGAWGEYFINGVEGARLPKTLAGYQVTRVVESEKITRTYVHVADDETIEFKTYKDWVSVVFHGPSHSRYMGSTGMLGSHDNNGKLLGRDGKTLFTDMEAFGQEWQVQGDEEMLFHSARLPQAPEKCILPAPAQEQRRLGESLAAEAAEAACRKAGWSVNTIEMCIHDVMATGDLELASAGAM